MNPLTDFHTQLLFALLGPPSLLCSGTLVALLWLLILKLRRRRRPQPPSAPRMSPLEVLVASSTTSIVALVDITNLQNARAHQSEASTYVPLPEQPPQPEQQPESPTTRTRTTRTSLKPAERGGGEGGGTTDGEVPHFTRPRLSGLPGSLDENNERSNEHSDNERSNEHSEDEKGCQEETLSSLVLWRLETQQRVFRKRHLPRLLRSDSSKDTTKDRGTQTTHTHSTATERIHLPGGTKREEATS